MGKELFVLRDENISVELSKVPIDSKVIKQLRPYLQNSNVYSVLDLQDNASKEIILIKIKSLLIGYSVIRLVHSEEFESLDEAEKIESTNLKLDNGNEFVYIEAVELFASFKGKGLGHAFVNYIKKQYKQPLILYALDEALSFWNRMGFIPFGSGTKWLAFNPSSSLAIH